MIQSRTIKPPPQQDRSRATQERILASASALLEQRGYAEFTLQKVCKGSGLSIGAIYSRFSSKDELLRTVQEKHIEQLDKDVTQIVRKLAAQDGSLQSTAPAVVKEFCELYRKHQLLLRPLMALGTIYPSMGQAGKKWDTRTKQQFRHLLLRHGNGIKHPAPERAVDTCFEVLFASVTHVLGLGTAPNVMGTAPKVKSKSIWRDFVEDLSQMVSAFLLSDLSDSSISELATIDADGRAGR
jgi:AcrR family transcriptional regulator